MIVLVVGGAKSGKSMFAQNLSKSLNESLKNPISGQLDGEIERRNIKYEQSFKSYKRGRYCFNR